MRGIGSGRIATVCLMAGVLAVSFWADGRQAFAFDSDVVKRSVVRVVTEGGHGTGFVVNENGHVVTNNHVIDGVLQNGGRLGVVPTGSDTVYTAEIIHASQSRDLAVLRAQGLELPPLTLSTGERKDAQVVWSAGFPGAADDLNPQNNATIQKDIISALHMGSWGRGGRFPIIQHGASTSPGSSGGPLLDDCNRVIGVNTWSSLLTVKDAEGRITRVPHGSGIFWASDIVEAVRILSQLSIPFQTEDSACITADESEGLREELQEQREQIEESLGEIQEQSEAEREQREQQMQEQQEQIEAEREQREQQMQEQREQIDESLEEMQEESEKERLRTVLILLVGGLVLAIVVILSLKNIRRKVLELVKDLGQSMQAQGEGERSWLSIRKRASRRGLVVSGFDGRGNRLRVVLSSDRFSKQRLGISFGRDPALVDEVVNDPSMSSRHLRISSAHGGKFYVEDLNSRNGTILDGRKLQPFQAEQVDYNSTLTAGDVELTLSKR